MKRDFDFDAPRNPKRPCTHDQVMIRLARQIASLERRQRNLKRELKIIAADLRTRRAEN